MASSANIRGSEKQPSRNRRNPVRLGRPSNHKNETFSFADLQALLQEHCPEEYAVMLERSTLTFEDWKGVKRLRIGQLRSDNVYTVIGGGGNNNRISFIYGLKDIKLDICSTHHVELDQPFRDVCWSGRLFQLPDEERLRAVICFWFLKAGYIDTLKIYRDFERYLIEACQWIGGAALTKTSPMGEIISSETSVVDDLPTSSQPDLTNRITSQSAEERRAPSFIEFGSGVQTNMANKRARLDDALAAVQRRHNEQTADLAVIHQELTHIQPSTEVSAAMQHRIFNQEQDIERLKDKIQALTNDLELAQGSTKEAREDLERERRLRLQVERKLNEYIDAQKKMAAQFS